MNPEHVKHLRCPKTKCKLDVEIGELENGKIKTGNLIALNNGKKYPIIDFIPRFVPEKNYAANFGIEWNIHNRTQFDDSSGFNVSEERFRHETKWGYKLEGEIILEAGSGSGRFTKHALETKAMVISFDFSSAVEANYKSNGHAQNLLIVQASIYEMPFEDSYFDRVFCFGVIQHTPKPRWAFSCLVSSLKNGGHLSSDIYLKSFSKIYTTPKYLIRKVTKKMNPQKLYKYTVRYINFMWPIARLIMKIPVIGKKINWRLMIADYSILLKNADSKTLKEWAVLDTYDMVSPVYDLPETVKSFRKWHEDEGLINIDVHRGYNGVEGRATKNKLE